MGRLQNHIKSTRNNPKTNQFQDYWKVTFDLEKELLKEKDYVYTVHSLNKSFKLLEVVCLHEIWAESEVGKSR